MSNTNTGIVYLIGAGPGDPELITVKGKRLLAQADVVIYDYLVPDELIVTLSSQVERHYVGKRAGSHSLPQDEINKLMVEHARAGKRVARLKGSDPLIFGRGGEEARYLKENRIKFEIIPGVTSGIAAPAYAGIPCTDREMASFLLLVTGHKAKGKSESVDWEWVAKAKHGTVVVYMGVSEIGSIVEQLMTGGMSAQLPVAIIERGTSPTQRTLATTLAKLQDTVLNKDVKAPALFLFGETVNLRQQMDWFHGRPLSGLRVMVTRAADQAIDFYQQLRELGAEVQPYPTIATEMAIDEKEWRQFEQIEGDHSWLVFTSENGVNYFVDQFAGAGYDIRQLGKFKIAAIGAGTERALAKLKLKPDFVPTTATVETLTRELLQHGLDDATVVRVRGNLANPLLEKVMKDNQVKCLPLTLYQTFHPQWSTDLKEKLLENPPDVVIFTSGSTVEGLFENLDNTEIEMIFRRAIVASIGPATSSVVKSHGLSVAIEAGTHTVPGIIAALLKYYQQPAGE